MTNLKPSEIFEGENSSLRKTYENAVNQEETWVNGFKDTFVIRVANDTLSGTKIECDAVWLNRWIQSKIQLALSKKREEIKERIGKAYVKNISEMTGDDMLALVRRSPILKSDLGRNGYNQALSDIKNII